MLGFLCPKVDHQRDSKMRLGRCQLSGYLHVAREALTSFWLGCHLDRVMIWATLCLPTDLISCQIRLIC